MSNVTRKFVLWNIQCKKVGIDEAGNPAFEKVWTGTVYDVVMTDAKARRVIREQTGITKLDSSYYISVKPLREDVLAMTKEAFINAAEIVSSTDCE